MSRNDKQQQHSIIRTRFHPCLPPRFRPDDSDSRAKTKLQVASNLIDIQSELLIEGPAMRFWKTTRAASPYCQSLKVLSERCSADRG
jgi:hypothetical protein